jgi:DNA-binding PadR family transcriptional regulator
MAPHHEHDHTHDHEDPHDRRIAGRPGRGGRGPGGHWGGRGGRGPWGGGRGGWGGGRRMPRGAVRTAILASLREGPAHGYEVMRRLEEMSGGLWRPSPGSVYPHLQMLEDEGMVQASEVEGSRVYSLTEAGRTEAEAGPLPWQEGAGANDEVRNLRLAVGQLMSAAKQLAGAGESQQVERGIAVIHQARKELYQILAED